MAQNDNTLTIAQLERGTITDPIWALNGSASSKVRAQGEVHVGIPKQNGTKTDDLHLPQSWLPVCLTEQVPRRQLLEASEFRNAVASGLIIPITEDYALALLSQEGAQEEKDRLNEREQQIKDATAARTIQGSGADVITVEELTNINAGASVAGAEDDKPNALSSGFTMFVASIKDKAPIEALNRIRSRGQYTKPEIKYMLKELQHNEKVVAFLKPHAN